MLIIATEIRSFSNSSLCSCTGRYSFG